jgi:hypothetical protein
MTRRMKTSLFLAIAIAMTSASPAPALATEGCRIGDICVMQSPLFGCKDASLIKRWIDLYVDQDRETAEKFIDDQVAAGQCARFRTGDKLRLVRYLGLRRLVVSRPGESQTFIMLLK